MYISIPYIDLVPPRPEGASSSLELEFTKVVSDLIFGTELADPGPLKEQQVLQSSESSL